MIQSIMAVVNSNHFHCVFRICLDNLHGKSPLTGQLSQLSSLFQVVRKWRSLAIRLGLSEYILDIDCWRGASGTSGTSRRRRGSREKDKMELFMKVWRETKPEMYTVTNLKTLLSAEVNTKIMAFSPPLILTDKVAAWGVKMYFSEHKTLPAAVTVRTLSPSVLFIFFARSLQKLTGHICTPSALQCFLTIKIMKYGGVLANIIKYFSFFLLVLLTQLWWMLQQCKTCLKLTWSMHYNNEVFNEMNFYGHIMRSWSIFKLLLRPNLFSV